MSTLSNVPLSEFKIVGFVVAHLAERMTTY